MMETVAPGLHDAILLGAGIAAVYLVVAVLQLMQLKRPRIAALQVREPSLGTPSPLHAEPPEPTDSRFAEHLKQRNLEGDMKRLGREVEHLHAELRAMRDELKQLRSARSFAVPPSAAPLYNEAMSFARRGVNAAGIATRCGISLGEAELVAALARDPKEFGLTENELPRKPTTNGRHERAHDGYRAAA